MKTKQNYNMVSRIMLLCNLMLLICMNVLAEGYLLVERTTGGGFPLLNNGRAATIVYDSVKEHSVVGIAAKALSSDIKMLSDNRTEPLVQNTFDFENANVIIGTVGVSTFLDELIKSNAIIRDAANKISGKWETFCIQAIKYKEQPTLVIMGSDPRGTAYGVFELSRKAGLSPWYWWADVNPEITEKLFVETDGGVYGPPSVKFRGIFINDEDWGLKPWASSKMDPSIKDIGPNTYRRVFELMLRLKANYIWPAMHEVTKAFWYYPENPILAKEYDIILGASHCEPMLRNNVFEWGNMGYSKNSWRWDTNSSVIRQYWSDRVAQSKNQDAVYTVGMRGIHDGSMPGYSNNNEKAEGLKDVIKNQREIFEEQLGVPANTVPQIFCPYKEVLTLYKLGLDLPDDITLCWADDNHGYIRQLSDNTEMLRSGGGGVYYHFSYYGAPIDYLWLSSISPSLTSFEMSKAYVRNCKNLWVFNVGDLKPAESEIQFAMDFAWNVEKWSPSKASEYIHQWAEELFGATVADNIEQIKRLYYRLGAEGKPEHIHAIAYTEAEMNARLADYARLVEMVDKVCNSIPARLSDAFFELIDYPCRAAAAMNRKHLYASKSFLAASRGDKNLTIEYGNIALDAYQEIISLTNKYNTGIANGKWNGMMSYKPRELSQFNKPTVATLADVTEEHKIVVNRDSVVKIKGTEYCRANAGSENFCEIDLLGIGGSSLAVWPLQKSNYSKLHLASAPYAEYNVPVKSGTNYIAVRCLPSFPIHSGMSLRCAVSVSNKAPVVHDLTLTAESNPWNTYVIQGFSEANETYESDIDTTIPVRVYFMDPGLVVSEIDVTMPINAQLELIPNSDITDYYIINADFSRNSGGNGTLPIGWTWTGSVNYSKISTGKKPDNATDDAIIIRGEQNHWQIWQGNGIMSQEIGKLPEGQYRLQATILASGKGSNIFAGEHKTSITIPGGKFSVDFEVSPSNIITIGIDKQCSVIEVDDFKLTYVGPLKETGIMQPSANQLINSNIYDLRGRLLFTANNYANLNTHWYNLPSKRVYIVDGKKIMK